MKYKGYQIKFDKKEKEYYFIEEISKNHIITYYNNYKTIDQVKQAIQQKIFREKQAENILKKNNGSILKSLLDWTLDDIEAWS